MNNDIFLTQNQLYDDTALDVIKKRKTKAVITDYAIILGGYVSNFDNESNLKYRIGSYFTGSYNESSVGIVYDDGKNYYTSLKRRDTGIRLVIPFKDKIPSNNGIVLEKPDGVLEVEYGYYPQDTVTIKLEEKLNNKFLNNNIRVTGNIHLFDFDGNITTINVKIKTDKNFRPKILKEYKFDNRYFVRVQIDSCYCGEYFYLSNYKNYGFGDYVWIEVKPVRWFVDEINKVLISEKILFSGVQYSENIGFKDTLNNIDIFIKNILVKDLFQRKNLSLETNISSSKYSILKEQLQIMKEELEYYKKENMELELDKQILTKENELYEMAYDKLKTIRKK